MSKIDKVQKIESSNVDTGRRLTVDEERERNSEVIMLTDADLTITGRGRGREHSALYVAAAALPAPQDGKYAALKTTGQKISAVNNTVQALRRDYPGRQYATRNRGAFIVRIS